MDNQIPFEKLVNILLKEQKQEYLRLRNEKLKRILLLLGKGVVLATIIAAPNTARHFKGFFYEKSDWNQWKIFNTYYLKRTLRKLEKQKLIEVGNHDGYAEVKISEAGRRRILKFGIDNLNVEKPAHWDGKWRLVFYDVLGGRRVLRDKFRSYLKLAGFYQLQESVYLHAFPCEKEMEFLKYYLGIGSEVQIIIAESIENDLEFREFFGV
ncbi:hypothetical protein HYT02_03240 [Candidatus Gottesmanbacteria bacterium]|nr:hypothetical protein [Candidatus Gottesmanbacteria bacterium]